MLDPSRVEGLGFLVRSSVFFNIAGEPFDYNRDDSLTDSYHSLSSDFYESRDSGTRVGSIVTSRAVITTSAAINAPERVAKAPALLQLVTLQ